MGAQPSTQQSPPRCNSELVATQDLRLSKRQLQRLTTQLFAVDRREAWRDARTVTTIGGSTASSGGGSSGEEPAAWSYVLQNWRAIPRHSVKTMTERISPSLGRA